MILGSLLFHRNALYIVYMIIDILLGHSTLKSLVTFVENTRLACQAILMTKCFHNANFVVSGGTGGCRYDNLIMQPLTTHLASWQLSVFTVCTQKCFFLWFSKQVAVSFIVCHIKAYLPQKNENVIRCTLTQCSIYELHFGNINLHLPVTFLWGHGTH